MMTVGEVITYQLVLLSDTLRVDSYREAIVRTVEPGQVVVDLGSGAGVLARFAALAGASRVIAIEQKPELCALHEHINRALGLDEVIEIVNGRVEDVRLDREVDVVVSELIGDLVDDEGMSGIMAAFLAAQGRHLAPDVRLIPLETVLFGQVVEVPEDREPTSRGEKEAVACFECVLAGEPRVLTRLGGLTTVGEPFRLLSVDAHGVRSGGMGELVEGFSAAGSSSLPRVMACWFDACLAEGVHLDSRGTSKVSSSWGWPLVPLLSDPATAKTPRDDLQLTFSLDGVNHDIGSPVVEARLCRG
ncbi:MAG: 50S ribosomal protein L11 methyltransferase [Acidobacteriota bacterium]|nr:50S ribosomal protein L11 methyltransferase [Acidobacteriota bacterium]MDH3524059.1 50S ribosomal protein L11 methyltransferase [Acidobacteriota bacterium]